MACGIDLTDERADASPVTSAESAGPMGRSGSHGPGPVSTAQLKLLERMRQALRSQHYSRRTEKTYLMWVRRFIFFHNVRHPSEMDEAETNTFLTHTICQRVVR